MKIKKSQLEFLIQKNIKKVLNKGFFDDLDKLNSNQDDGFRDLNSSIYDEHSYILSPDKNPEFFYGLCDMCKKYYPNLPSNENGFTQEDLNQITYLSSSENFISYFNFNCVSYFKNIASLNELQYFNNLKKIQVFCFFNCTKLKSVIFPKNLEIIDYNSFDTCNSLEKLYLPKNLIKIENLSFERCSSLKEIIIPEKFKNRMNSIFYNVDLTNINITYI